MNLLFAQQQKGVPPGFPPEMAAFLGIIAIAAVIGLIIGLVIMAFFCMTNQKALNACAEHNRLMQPGMVWLLLIPCVNAIWIYFVVINVPGSLKKEFEDRGRDDGTDYGKTMGLVAAIMMSANILISCVPFLNYCTAVTGIIQLVFFIIYWVKVAGYAGQLGNSGD